MGKTYREDQSLSHVFQPNCNGFVICFGLGVKSLAPSTANCCSCVLMNLCLLARAECCLRRRVTQNEIHYFQKRRYCFGVPLQRHSCLYSDPPPHCCHCCWEKQTNGYSKVVFCRCQLGWIWWFCLKAFAFGPTFQVATIPHLSPDWRQLIAPANGLALLRDVFLKSFSKDRHFNLIG